MAISGSSLKNFLIKENTFKGFGWSGIFSLNGDNWEIVENNFCKLRVTNNEAATIFLNQHINSIITKNANQIVGGPSANDPSNKIGEEKSATMAVMNRIIEPSLGA